MNHKVSTLASNSQNYVQKDRRQLDTPLTSATDDDHVCPKCQLPFGSDCNGICFEPYWVKSSEIF